ncbi:MAG: hypothetical protein H7281_12680 [Bacteriovorax sp.]|nr:hypothetical protein [Bacteriovorax sp.]
MKLQVGVTEMKGRKISSEQSFVQILTGNQKDSININKNMILGSAILNK